MLLSVMTGIPTIQCDIDKTFYSIRLLFFFLYHPLDVNFLSHILFAVVYSKLILKINIRKTYKTLEIAEKMLEKLLMELKKSLHEFDFYYVCFSSAKYTYKQLVNAQHSA